MNIFQKSSYGMSNMNGNGGGGTTKNKSKKKKKTAGYKNDNDLL